MKILVTGGAGFIGSNFIHYWLKNHPDDQIINLDVLTYAGNLESLKDIEKNPNYKFIRGDITDPKMVNEVMSEIDWVVHFAAESHVDRALVDSQQFIKTNVLGTQILLDAALKHQVKRFHHISTDEVFGAIAEGENRKFNEQTPYNPRNPYAASKAGSDHLIRTYFYSFGLPITITNCSNNFGPYHFPEKFIPLSITNILEGQKATLYGSGRQSRDWLYVEDHCSAIEAVLEKGKVGETYCVGGMNEQISNLKVLKMICQILGVKDKEGFEFVPDRPGHDFQYIVDWSKIKNELGWAPKYSFEEWLEKTVKWFKDNEWWWKPLKEGRPGVDRLAQKGYLG